ncbi:MAG: bacteriohopanetetrol glucosamine biosynthesis glycosyltransferase HpnI [Rhodospirillales bacterium]|nr:bacteriohopanetetrol glucosamine biosynthesis glycosyltransferase HpnI [Rhodospirillales bacterium]
MQIIALTAALLTLAGLAQQVFGALLAEQFCKNLRASPSQLPGVSVLKPLYGTEALTELALESFFLLDYPVYQLVFGVQSKNDPVLAVLSNLRARYPKQDIAVMVNDAEHGRNRKVSNLINMKPLAKHEVIVISDADVHVPPYYLNAILAAFEEPDVGLVTTIYTGLPANPSLAAQLGVAQLNYNFLPGALLARRLGRQDCMGVTMAIRAGVLEKIGGLEALANYLADDQVLGRLVLAAGQKIALAPVIPATTVPEQDFASLFQHELRWARTIRALVPVAYLGTIFQMPLLLAALAMAFSVLSIWSVLLFVGALGVRAMTAWRIEAALGLPKRQNIWLFLLRDFFSTLIYIASFTGNRVDWHGQPMVADSGRVDFGRKSE